MKAVIIGGSGGIGRSFIDHLLLHNSDITIHATFNTHKPESYNSRCHWHHLDIRQEAQIQSFCERLDEIDLCINTVGMLHDDEHRPEKSTQQIDQDYFLKSISLNALPTLLLGKYLGAHFKHKRPAVFATVSARVGSISENSLGGWYSYRASKAALNMILKTLSIEWKRSLPNVAVAALHPGTTDTALSKPFQQHVPANALFTPQQSVHFMMQVISNLNAKKTGHFWSFDGTILPW